MKARALLPKKNGGRAMELSRSIASSGEAPGGGDVRDTEEG